MKFKTLFAAAILLLMLTPLISTAFATPVEKIALVKAVTSIQQANAANKPDKPTGPPQKSVTYELFIEIDWMTGHHPTQEVLDYIVGYYSANGITVTFNVDDEVTYDGSVNEADFWAIEAQYNDGDDKANGDINAGVYTSKDKWVLFGSNVAEDSSTVGYTIVLLASKGRNVDALAGNYIFIADEATDDWADSNGISRDGAEAVVLMHELGHSIGIGVFSGLNEVYDSDLYSVMSFLNVYNAGNDGSWYYSKRYWSTKNLGYYEV
jgi:hypothetical protein